MGELTKFSINPLFTTPLQKINAVSLLNLKPTVPTVGDLPTTGNTENDVRIVSDTGTVYRWDGSTWELIGDIIDVYWSSIIGKPDSAVGLIDDAVDKRHIQNTDIAVDLGGVYETDAGDIRQAADKAHDQNTDTILNTLADFLPSNGIGVSASSENPSYPASQSCDDSIYTRWEASDGTFPQSLEVDLQFEFKIVTKLYIRNNGGIKDFVLYGKEYPWDSWVQLLSSATASPGGDFYFNIPNTTAYGLYKLTILSKWASTFVATIPEWQLLGVQTLLDNSTLKSNLLVNPLIKINGDPIEDYADAIDKKHTQNTDTKLDEGGANEVTAVAAKDAVNKKHTQGTDQALDTGGANQVTAAQAKTAYTHSQLITGNPHQVTAAQAGASPVGHNHNLADLSEKNHASLTNKDAETSYQHITTTQKNGLHTHTNKAQLDLVTDGDHDVRIDNPHGVTAAQTGASPTTHNHTLTSLSEKNHASLTNKNTETDIKHITDTQKNALDNADSPSTTNPIMTLNDVDGYYVEDDTENNTASGSPQQKLRMSFTPAKTGDYILSYSAELANNTGNGHASVRVQQDDSATLAGEVVKCSISAGDYCDFAGFKKVALTASTTYNFDIDYWRTSATGTAYIRNARLQIRRII